MVKFEEIKYKKKLPRTGHYLLIADIGGTNSSFALVQIKKAKPVIYSTFSGKSNAIINFSQIVANLVMYIKKEYGINLTQACFAIAGVVSEKKNFGRLTNVPLHLDASSIKKQSGLKSVLIINDFEANGYAIDILPKKSITTIRSQKKVPKQKNKALLGAGTGLGKSILIWDCMFKQHIPSASEGGHSDFPAQNEQELELLEFIKKIRRLSKKTPIEWEDILSGSGLQNIYRYLGTSKQYKQTVYGQKITRADYNPYLISHYRKKDTHCYDTFELFTKFFARSAKNFALDALALSGVYFSGGIAAGNPDIFKKDIFRKEFINTRKQAALLKSIPIYVLTDTKIGLYGAAMYSLFHAKIIEYRT